MLTKSTLKRASLKAGPKSILSKAFSKRQDSAKSIRYALRVHCMEVSGRKYNESVCATLPLRFGARITELEKERLFSAQCYRTATTILTNERTLTMVKAILDIGAGQDSVLENVLPTPLVVVVHRIRASMKATGDTIFLVESVTCLPVEMDRQETNAVFGVTPRRATKMIFETAFIDKNVDENETKVLTNHCKE